MWQFKKKKGFTLIEVLLVMVILTISFSVAINILNSTPNFASSGKYVEKDLLNIKNILSEIKYQRIAGIQNISVKCEKNELSVSSGELIDVVNLSYLICIDQSVQIKFIQSQSISDGLIEPFYLKFKESSSGLIYTINLNKYGQILVNNGF